MAKDETDFMHARMVFKRRLLSLGKELNGLDTSKSNMDPIFMQVWMARECASFGDAWKKEMEKELASGFDISKTCDQVVAIKPGGAPEMLLKGDIFGVQCTRKRPASRIDHTKFRNLLRRAGVTQKVLDACLEEASSFNKPATTIEAVWL